VEHAPVGLRRQRSLRRTEVEDTIHITLLERLIMSIVDNIPRIPSQGRHNMARLTTRPLAPPTRPSIGLRTLHNTNMDLSPSWHPAMRMAIPRRPIPKDHTTALATRNPSSRTLRSTAPPLTAGPNSGRASLKEAMRAAVRARGTETTLRVALTIWGPRHLMQVPLMASHTLILAPKLLIQALIISHIRRSHHTSAEDLHMAVPCSTILDMDNMDPMVEEVTVMQVRDALRSTRATIDSNRGSPDIMARITTPRSRTIRPGRRRSGRPTRTTLLG
jgi:hypothetical protein